MPGDTSFLLLPDLVSEEWKTELVFVLYGTVPIYYSIYYYVRFMIELLLYVELIWLHKVVMVHLLWNAIQKRCYSMLVQSKLQMAAGQNGKFRPS